MAREDIAALIGSHGLSDYGYVNARIRAMGASLFAKGDWERFLKAENLDALTSLLSNTDYGVDIKAAEQKFVKGMRHSEVIEDGLKQNFLRTIAKVQSFLDGKPAELMKVALIRWDIFNIKTIIRGKQANLHSAQIIQSMFPIGTLEPDFLEKLAQKQDVKEVIDTLVPYTNIATPLRTNFAEYLTTQKLVDLELAMEKWYYENALEICDHSGEDFKLVRQFVQNEIDITNAITCLKLARVDIEPEDAMQFFIPGGARVRRNEFVELINMGGVEDIISWLERVPVLREGLQDGLELFKKRDDISVFERLFEANLIRKARTAARGESLGFSILMAYFRRKYNELVNLRVVLKAVEFGLPLEDVRRELVFV